MNSNKLHKNFIIKAVSFIGIVLILLCITFIINNLNNNHLKYKIPFNKKTLIIGDSHALFGINADTIGNAHISCYYHESNALTYIKLKFIHQQNKHLKNIITSISYQKLSSRFDSTFYNSTLSNEIFKHYFPIIHLNEIQRFKINYQNYWENYFRYKIFPNFASWNLTTKECFEYPFEKKQFIITGKSFDTKKLKQNVLRYFPDSSDTNLISKLDIQYIDSIADYTQLHNLNLFFIFLPQQQLYMNEIPNKIKNEYELLKIKLIEHPNVYFEDQIKTLPESYFFDYSHLNINGATYMSKILKARIEQIEKNKQQL